jgi:hypothetical protein
VLHKFSYNGIEDGRTFVVDCSNCPELIAGMAQRVSLALQEILYELYGGMYKIDIRNNIVMQRVENKLKIKNEILEKELVKELMKTMNAKVKSVKVF